MTKSKNISQLFTRIAVAALLVVGLVVAVGGEDELSAQWCGPGPGKLCASTEICILGVCWTSKSYWTAGEPPDSDDPRICGVNWDCGVM